MLRVKREEGQTLAGYILILAPAASVVSFALAVLFLTG